MKPIELLRLKKLSDRNISIGRYNQKNVIAELVKYISLDGVEEIEPEEVDLEIVEEEEVVEAELD